MHTQTTDSELASLDDQGLRGRLARTDREHDPLYVPDEQVFRLFRQARDGGTETRHGLLSNALGRRLLNRSRAFAVRSGLYPGIIGDLGQAAQELSQFLWECLVTRPNDAKHAERYFGQLFKRRALDFQRRLLSEKRKCEVSIDAMDRSDNDNEDPERAVREIAALRHRDTPEAAYEIKQRFAQTAGRLQAVLTKNEYTTYVMLYVEEMQVKDIASALGVSTRTVNTYKNAALAKIEKEFRS